MPDQPSLTADNGGEEYDFHLRATAHDREGYYVPRWDKAVSIVMRAATKQDAINKAAVALGPCPRGDYWGFKVAGDDSWLASLLSALADHRWIDAGFDATAAEEAEK